RMLYTLSLPDALPICVGFQADWRIQEVGAFIDYLHACKPQPGVDAVQYPGEYEAANRALNKHQIEFAPAIWDSLAKLGGELNVRSEEHTSELQSRENL